MAISRHLTPPGRASPLSQAALRAAGSWRRMVVDPGATVEVPFLLTWNYPNKYNEAGTWMGCHHSTVWTDAAAVVHDVATNMASFREQTERFRKTFYDSTLPYWLLDCLTSQAAIIRHIGVVFRIANGDIFGWEGSNGCCQPTCTHVWGYEQTLSDSFPISRKRCGGSTFTAGSDGGVNNRTDVPRHPDRPASSRSPTAMRAAFSRPTARHSITRMTRGSRPTGHRSSEPWNTSSPAMPAAPVASLMASSRTTSGTPTTRLYTA